MSFWEMLVQQNNVTYTENGDKALKSSLSGCSDLLFFGGMGKDKATTVTEIVNVFKSALKENPLYAIRLLFYNRDIRGGQGSRRFFRECLKYLMTVDEELCINILKYIPEYGRWDDILCVINEGSNKVTEAAMQLISNQLKADNENLKNGKSISLLAKWLPSENASSEETKKKATYIRKWHGLSSREYRKILSGLRAYLKIVERNVSAKTYSEIDYSQVPSKAMMKYRSAFGRHDNERFNEYLVNVGSGKAKINAATLYPFDIIEKYMNGLYVMSASNYDETIEAMWKNLPDFFNGKKDNSIVVADVSGSMTGKPICACVGLALYIAEHNTGAYHNKFITFSEHPTLQDVKGKTLRDKINHLCTANWSMNTDLDAVFNLLHKTATSNNVPQEELPGVIYIISDMQFDSCCIGRDKSTYEKWEEKFTDSGYKMPMVVFWNVSDRCKTVPVTFDKSGTILVSGYSPAVCKFIMDENRPSTSGEMVKLICESERYASILSEL